MRIVVNCRSILLPKRTGIGRYTYHLLAELGGIDPGNEYLLYAQKNLFDRKRQLPRFEFSNFKPALDMFRRPIPRADVYHLPCPMEIGVFEGRVAVTIHDLVFKTYPQSHTQETVDMTESLMAGIVKRADHIICISQSTRNDLHRFFDYPKRQTSVVLNGVDHNRFFPLSNTDAAKTFLKSNGMPEDFLLFVGTVEPRKNLTGLLEAMSLVKQAALPLVVVGMPGWKSEGVTADIERLGLQGKVIFTGFIRDEELNFLYNTCKVFIFPSFYEGFGFPIVEAMSAGAAVICSSTSSCGEIAGDAAILIDPKDPAGIANAIERVAQDPDLVTSLKIRCLQRAQEFSFKRTAQETLGVYQALGGSNVQ